MKRIVVLLLFAVLSLPVNGLCLSEIFQDTARVGEIGDFLRLETKSKIVYIKKEIVKSVTLSRAGENVVILISTDETGPSMDSKSSKLAVSKIHTLVLKEASLAKDTLNKIMKIITFKPEKKPTVNILGNEF